MKKILFLLMILFSVIISTNIAQAQIECVGCNEMNGKHKTTCKYYNPPRKSNSNTPGANLENEIVGMLFQSMLKSMLSGSNSEKSAEEKRRLEKENKERMKQLAIKQAELIRYNEALRQVEHDKMMKNYKKLDGSNNLTYKGIDDGKKQNATVIFNCKITSYKGEVRILKSNGQMQSLSENQSVDLAVGDIIATGINSRIKLHYNFESGGEDILLGQKSALSIITNEDGRPIPKLIGGRMYLTNNKVTEKTAEYIDDLYTKVEIEKNKILKPYKSKFEVRTPIAVCAVRGTEFTIYVDSTGATEVVVKNGVIDLKGNNLIEHIITLTAGYKGLVTSFGEVIGPIKIEESEIEKWWEKD